MRIGEDLLLSMARRGEPDAVCRFAKRWWTAIYRFAFNMLGNASQAAAVTEETMVVLLEPAHEPGEARTLVYRIALHFCLLRRRWAPHPIGQGSPIRQALQRVPDLDRAALLLRDVEALPIGEIAAILRASPAEARARAHRARLLLMDVTSAHDQVSKAG